MIEQEEEITETPCWCIEAHECNCDVCKIEEGSFEDVCCQCHAVKSNWHI